jgi:hypothetical protein
MARPILGGRGGGGGEAGCRFIFAPPGCGKTTYLQYINNPFHPLGNRFGIVDADDVLSQIYDDASGTNLVQAMGYYMQTEGFGWDKWHRVCFRALIRAQVEQNLGPILCGFMVGENFEEVQSGFDKFVGTGPIESLPGIDKIRPEHIVVVLPSEKVLAARGASRTNRPVDLPHVQNCLRNYSELAGRYPGRIRAVSDLSQL